MLSGPILVLFLKMTREKQVKLKKSSRWVQIRAIGIIFVRGCRRLAVRKARPPLLLVKDTLDASCIKVINIVCQIL